MNDDLIALVVVCIIGFFLIYYFSPSNTINWEIMGWILIGTAAFMAVEWYTDIIYEDEDDDNEGGKLIMGGSADTCIGCIEGGGDEHKIIENPAKFGGEIDNILDNIVDM